MRIREYSDAIPKPMVPIGEKPILWHVMKYYAHFGHKDFILCTGYKGDVIKEYFAKNGSVNGVEKILPAKHDLSDWNITVVDTGRTATVGQRLKAVQPWLKNDEMFLANYTDALTDLHFPEYFDYFSKRKKIASFLCVRPSQQFHVVSTTGDMVQEIARVDQSNTWMNGGFFIFRREFFDYLNEDEDLVETPFQRLIQSEELVAYKYRGFWVAMDTFKERQRLEDVLATGNAPWELWKRKLTAASDSGEHA